MKELSSFPTTLVAFVGAVTVVPAQALQLLTVTATIRVVRATTLVSESHFIKVDLIFKMGQSQNENTNFALNLRN